MSSLSVWYQAVIYKTPFQKDKENSKPENTYIKFKKIMFKKIIKYNYLILFIKTRKLVLFLFKDTYKWEVFNNTS